MNPEEAARAIEEARLISVIRLGRPELGHEVVAQLVEGGVRMIEFSLAMPDALTLLRDCTDRFGDRAVFGAGTVMSAGQANEAVEAGAAYLVSPNVDAEVASAARTLDVLHVPGALTPTEVAGAMALGAQLIKLFPARAVGPAYVRDLLGPFPDARLVPTGGVGEDNAAEYLRAGAVAVAVGGSLVGGDISEVPPSLSATARRLAEVTSTGGGSM
jgi:2-dehydro-3-deoxyphosphogluconate aldolase / (4S)-4-hydroxy-2-oxoglutarate aldolase